MAKQIDVYVVESDVPIPQSKESAVPIDQLQVGESIKFPLDKRDKVQVMASKLKARKGKVFTVKAEDEKHARVWRVE